MITGDNKTFEISEELTGTRSIVDELSARFTDLAEKQASSSDQLALKISAKDIREMAVRAGEDDDEEDVHALVPLMRLIDSHIGPLKSLIEGNDDLAKICAEIKLEITLILTL